MALFLKLLGCLVLSEFHGVHTENVDRRDKGRPEDTSCIHPEDTSCMDRKRVLLWKAVKFFAGIGIHNFAVSTLYYG